ncbi:sigma-70 family RNA polymerase sigma factor [Catenulispora subtropica]|uniref:Sigma-70 family RNA polymerase sigma factor n=1 Tax=Catenulispora subtropica TaxID=450798 RepID=A0ABP5CP37_9ACTN
MSDAPSPLDPDAGADREPSLLAAARAGDPAAFDQLMAPYRPELTAHCYRMLGSPFDAEDAVQESLLSAWRGLGAFEGRSSVRTWLYRITTNACIRLGSQRSRRLLSPDFGPSRTVGDDLGEPVTEPVWLEPWPDPAESYLRREGVELAFVAALQHLPATQRAVLILREVLEFSAADVAELLDTTTASVNSALQRARQTMAAQPDAAPARQRSELAELGPDGVRALVDGFVKAWEDADVDALVDLLTADVRFTMPPLPAWFDGRDDVAGFFAGGVFATPWKLRPIPVNGQLGFACYQQRTPGGPFRLGAINLLTLRDGRIAQVSAFLDPELPRRFGIPEIFSENLAPDR